MGDFKHYTLRGIARRRAEALGHRMTQYQEVMPTIFRRAPVYMAMCKKCGQMAYVRPYPGLSDHRFDGAVFQAPCGLAPGALINDAPKKAGKSGAKK